MDYKSLIILELNKKDIPEAIIDSTIEKVKAYIKRHCNITAIPTDLDYVIVDMSVTILNNKYIAEEGQKEIKSKSMGDTSVTYNAVTKKELTYDALVEQFSCELNNYRCLRW